MKYLFGSLLILILGLTQTSCTEDETIDIKPIESEQTRDGEFHFDSEEETIVDDLNGLIR